MVVVEDVGRLVLLTQEVKKSPLLHSQLPINKLLINLSMLLITLCHALTSSFLLTKKQYQIMD